MIDDQSAIVTERGKHPGIGTAPHCTVHRVLVLLKCTNHLIFLGGRGAGGRCIILLDPSICAACPYLSSSPSSMSMCLRGSDAMDGSLVSTTWLSELAVSNS